ncbi:MAG: hypothetical protein JW982_07330 [Spirochaetes bacterium]|nr:hypothetical protein [Spirochaetota bacterium]
MKKEQKNFVAMLAQYLKIKGLDIVVYMKDGKEIELLKNRYIDNNEIVMYDGMRRETRISIDNVKSIDLFAA